MTDYKNEKIEACIKILMCILIFIFVNLIVQANSDLWSRSNVAQINRDIHSRPPENFSGISFDSNITFIGG